MGKHYSPETRQRIVRLARERIDGDDRSEWQRIRTVAKQFQLADETVRRWVRQAQIDDGEREGVPSEIEAELALMRQRNAELEATIEILKAAASFFARECDPLTTRS